MHGSTSRLRTREMAGRRSGREAGGLTAAAHPCRGRRRTRGGGCRCSGRRRRSIELLLLLLQLRAEDRGRWSLVQSGPGRAVPAAGPGGAASSHWLGQSSTSAGRRGLYMHSHRVSVACQPGMRKPARSTGRRGGPGPAGGRSARAGS
jgi:hypothetical protein